MCHIIIELRTLESEHTAHLETDKQTIKCIPYSFIVLCFGCSDR